MRNARWVGGSLVAFVWFGVVGHSATTFAGLPDTYLYTIGAQDCAGCFGAAARIETDARDNWYLTEDPGRVQVLAPDGSFVRAWAEPGSGEGQLSRPRGLAVGGDGTVYVADWGNHRVARFGPNGRFLGTWDDIADPSVPNGRRRFIPIDVAVTPTGTVLIGDWLDSRVYELAPDGTLLRTLGGPGAEEGRIAGLEAIDAAADGRIYVGDGGTPGRVHVFAADGSLVRRWDSGPVLDLAVTDTAVYVAVDSPAAFRVFSLDGAPVVPPGGPGPSPGVPEPPAAWRNPRSVANRPDGTVLLLDGDSDGIRAARLVAHDDDGRFRSERLSSPPVEGAFDPVSIELDLAGELHIADAANGHGQVHVMHPDGTHGATWADGGLEPDGIREPVGIAVQPQGPVLVSDRATGTVLELDADGRVAREIGAASDDTPGAFGAFGPGDLAARHEAASTPAWLYVADPSGGRVLAFDETGTVAAAFGAVQEGPGHLLGGPTHLATAPNGDVYVTDRSADQRVHVFGYDGRHRFGFHGDLGQDSRYVPLAGIDVAPGIGILLADPRGHVQAFDGTGVQMGRIDLRGARPDLTIEPGEIVAGADGRLFVADRAHRRVHVFGRERSGGWRREVFGNAWLAGAPVLVDQVDAIGFARVDSPPGPALAPDGTSERFSRFVDLDAGTYRLRAAANGALRVWIDGRLPIDDWTHRDRAMEATLALDAGKHYLQVAFADLAGPAALAFEIVAVSGPDARPCPEHGCLCCLPTVRNG